MGGDRSPCSVAIVGDGLDPRTARFARLVQSTNGHFPLDEAALLIAAHAYPDLSVATELGRLDALAAAVPTPTLDSLIDHLFRHERFSGNEDDYYDPRNSFLNDVLDRHIGIPITLSVVTMEVGRRIGVPVAGVGLPGHFLLRDKVDPGVFIDPFDRGRVLDLDGVERLFRRLHGPDLAFEPAFLDPLGPGAIVARILANLKQIYLSQDDRDGLTWVLRLRVLVPGVPANERAELARLMAPYN